MMLKKIRSGYLNNYMTVKKDNDDLSPKAKKPKKKSENNNANDKKEQPPKEPVLDPIIEKVIKDALMIHIANNSRRKDTVDELDAMVATCQEFMSSFIILGYDMNHQPIQPIVYAHNQQEADSLGAYMSKFIHHNIKEIDPSAE